MSAATRRPFAEALEAARAFAALFEGTHERWVIAGSLRRREATIGDCEHVVIPRISESVPAGGMFAQPMNAIWARCDELLEAGAIQKALYGQHQMTRWGPLLRGIVHDGMRHEIFTADALNFGSILAIRTGPAEFSERLVTAIKQGGRYRQQGGYLRYASGPSAGDVRACPTEEDFFAACGWSYREPEERR